MVVMSCFGSKDCTSLVKYKVKTKRGCAQVAYPPLFLCLMDGYTFINYCFTISLKVYSL